MKYDYVYIYYYDVPKITLADSTTPHPSTGLEEVKGKYRVYKVVDPKKWMFTVLKTGVQYVKTIVKT